MTGVSGWPLVIGTGLVLPWSPSANVLEWHNSLYSPLVGTLPAVGLHLLVGVEVQVEGWWMVDNLGRDDRLEAGTWLWFIMGQTLLACSTSRSSVARDQSKKLVLNPDRRYWDSLKQICKYLHHEKQICCHQHYLDLLIKSFLSPWKCRSIIKSADATYNGLWGLVSRTNWILNSTLKIKLGSSPERWYSKLGLRFLQTASPGQNITVPDPLWFIWCKTAEKILLSWVTSDCWLVLSGGNSSGSTCSVSSLNNCLLLLLLLLLLGRSIHHTGVVSDGLCGVLVTPELLYPSLTHRKYAQNSWKEILYLVGERGILNWEEILLITFFNLITMKVNDVVTKTVGNADRNPEIDDSKAMFLKKVVAVVINTHGLDRTLMPPTGLHVSLQI